MRLFRHHTDLPQDARGAVAAIGNFDGVHLGHQALIARAGAVARERGAPLGVLTFEPHPRRLFQPKAPPFRLTPLHVRAAELQRLGVELLYVLHFDRVFAERSAENFVAEILGGGLGICHAVVGEDFVFGHGRLGDVAMLNRLSGAAGFGVTAIAPVAAPSGEVFSSTRIRELLVRGEMAKAAALLGRHWEIEGRVVGGNRSGRAIGYPTANLRLDDYLCPANGIYAARIAVTEGEATRWRDGVAYVGRNATLGEREPVLEAHLFDFVGDLYGRHLRCVLVEHLRADRHFADVETLRAQIAEDCRQARRVLADKGREAPATGGSGRESGRRI